MDREEGEGSRRKEDTGERGKARWKQVRAPVGARQETPVGLEGKRASPKTDGRHTLGHRPERGCGLGTRKQRLQAHLGDTGRGTRENNGQPQRGQQRRSF